jgi:hypothetical protein
MHLTLSQTLAEAFEEICVMDAPLNERLRAYADKLRELDFPMISGGCTCEGQGTSARNRCSP